MFHYITLILCFTFLQSIIPKRVEAIINALSLAISVYELSSKCTIVRHTMENKKDNKKTDSQKRVGFSTASSN